MANCLNGLLGLGQIGANFASNSPLRLTEARLSFLCGTHKLCIQRGRLGGYVKPSFLHSKHIDLLSKFPQDATFVTSKTLADRAGLSQRSVKTFITEIRAEYPELIQPSVKGYKLKAELFKELDWFIHACKPDTPQKRILRIIRCLLEAPRDQIYVKKLAEDLFVSESTVRKLLPGIRKVLSQYDLKLAQPKGALRIEGEETAKRQMFIHTIYSEFSGCNITFAVLDQVFGYYDVSALEPVLLSLSGKSAECLNNSEVIDATMNLLIVLKRHGS